MKDLARLALAALIGLTLTACGDKPADDEAALDNTAEVEAYYVEHSDFFHFAEPADLPSGLVWQDGMDQPDIGSRDAIKGGTWHTRLADFPRTLRMTGPDSNGAFRRYILDDVRPSFANRHPETFDLYPGIASSWATSIEDKTVWVRIDPKARWSDGEAITTEDVLFSFFFYQSKYIVDGWYNNYFSQVYTGVTVYDELTFAVHFPEARPNMDRMGLAWKPVPRHFYYELGDDYVERYQWRVEPTPGPYTVRAEDIRKGRSIAITRVDNWWAQDKKFFRNRYNFDKVSFAVIRDEAKAFEAFRMGELETFSLGLAEYWYDKLPNSAEDVSAGYIEKATFYNVVPRPTWGLYVNEARPLLSNRDIRVGINYALNWDVVINRFFRGDAVRMRTANEGFGLFTHPTLQPRPFDPDKARAAFARAGYSDVGPDGILVNAAGERLGFTVSTGTESLKDVMTILREEALKAGLELRLEVLNATSGWKKVQEKKHDLHFTAFSQPLEMFPRYWEGWHSDNAFTDPFLEDGSVNPDRVAKTQTNNLQAIGHYELDKLIEVYRHSDSAEEMRDLAWKMEEILYAEASYIPGWAQPFYRVGHWRWLRYPEGFGLKHSNNANQFFVAWIDAEMKAKTLAARQSGKTFAPQVRTFDQYKE
jgi:microcin C transport system substrate-binding protein